MSPLVWLRSLCSKGQPKRGDELILTLQEQTKAWRKANRKMGWNITQDEFDKQEILPLLTDDSVNQGFMGTALFYGFGDDGSGNSDTILSSKLAWDYGRKRRNGKTWQCEYIDFDKSEDIRLRSGAPLRPKGFYYARLQSGKHLVHMTVSQLRKKLGTTTGWGPEGFQFLTITHAHFSDLMTEHKIPYAKHYLSKSHSQTLQPDRLSL